MTATQAPNVNNISDIPLADAMRAVYLASPYFLGRELLGYSRFCETQLEWSEYLTNVFNPRKPARSWSLVLAPRETFKSTFFTVTQVIWLLLNNPNITILIASETITAGESLLREIRAKLMSDTFTAMFGKLIDPRLDNASALNLISRKKHSKEANIEVAGLGKSITGRHYDVVIADDIAGVQDRDSDAKRKVTFAFFNDMMDILKKEAGYFQVIGTRWHRDDIYAHIKDRLAPDMERKDLGKFHVWCKPAHDTKTNNLNFPRLLPEHRLQELKTVKQGRDGVDISTYMAQYELNPLSPSEQIFKTFTTFNLDSVKFDSFILWTDPALSDKGSACYSACVVLARIVDSGKWAVPYASIERRDPSKIIKDHNRIYRMMRDLYKITGDAFMETNGFQMLLKNMAVQEALNENDDVSTIGRHNSENKLARIRSMEPYISQGFIVFREDWQTAPEGYNLLLEQLLSFPQGAMDGIDALQCGHNQTQSRFR